MGREVVGSYSWTKSHKHCIGFYGRVVCVAMCDEFLTFQFHFLYLMCPAFGSPLPYHHHNLAEEEQQNFSACCCCRKQIFCSLRWDQKVLWEQHNLLFKMMQIKMKLKFISVLHKILLNSNRLWLLSIYYVSPLSFQQNEEPESCENYVHIKDGMNAVKVQCRYCTA